MGLHELWNRRYPNFFLVFVLKKCENKDTNPRYQIIVHHDVIDGYHMTSQTPNNKYRIVSNYTSTGFKVMGEFNLLIDSFGKVLRSHQGQV